MSNEDISKETKKNKKTGIAKILDGSFLMDEWIIRQLPFIGLLVFLSFIFITSLLSAEKKLRKKNLLQEEITRLVAIESELNTEVSDLTKPTVIASKLKERGLKEAVDPKIKLRR